MEAIMTKLTQDHLLLSALFEKSSEWNMIFFSCCETDASLHTLWWYLR